MRLHTRFSTILLLWSTISYAEPVILSLQAIGHGENECFNDVYAAADGGYLCCGGTRTLEDATPRLYYCKFDRECNLTLEAIPEEAGNGTYGYSIIETDNHDVLIGGMANNRFAAFRLSGDGEWIWGRDYAEGRCHAVIELKDGNLLLAGKTGRTGLVILIDEEGNPIWQRTYSPGTSGFLECMREIENGVILGGVGQESEQVEYGFWAVNIEQERGDLRWSSVYRSAGACHAFSMVSTQGGWVLGGWAVGEGQDFCALKINQNGDLLWSQSYESEHIQEAFGIAKFTDGSFNLAGFNLRHAADNDLEIMRISADGEMISDERITPQNLRGENRFQAGDHRLYSIISGRNDEMITVGNVYKSDDGTYDALLMKLGSPILHAMNIIPEPSDTLFNTLTGSIVNFSVQIVGIAEDDIRYEWNYHDSVLTTESECSIEFNAESDNEIVECRVIQAEVIIPIVWRISVRDLFIASHSPDTLLISLRRGTSQSFSLDTVRAVEGDQVEYQWTLTDLNTFEREETGTEASATVEFLRSGNYRMEGLAYRGESSDNVIWTIAIRSAILDFWPRELNLSVPPDSSGTFGVLPFNPESDSLSYRWEVDGDSVGCDSTVSLSFAWNDRRIGNPPYLVSAIVMDGAEGDTVRWQVTVQDPNAIPPTPPSIEGGENPTTFGIVSASPNPFNNSTTIRFTVPFGSESAQSAKSAVRLTLHDLTGREVARLVDERAQQSPPSRGGPYAVTLNGRDLPAGGYLIRIETAGRHDARKVVILR